LCSISLSSACAIRGGVAVELTRGTRGRRFRNGCNGTSPQSASCAQGIIPKSATERSGAGVLSFHRCQRGRRSVAAACGRPTFQRGRPDAASMAANHAATAFQSARVEQGFVEPSELETKVRTDGRIAAATANCKRFWMPRRRHRAVRQDQVVQRCNPAFERIVGWRADQSQGAASRFSRPVRTRRLSARKPHADEAFARSKPWFARMVGIRGRCLLRTLAG